MDHGEKELHDCQGRCCAENDGHSEIETCGGCAGGAGGSCPGRAANGCRGCCPHAAGNEFEWDYDDTVLVFSSDMLEELP